MKASTLLWILALVLPGCGLVEAAGDVTIGEGQVPRLTFDLKWPKVDDLVADSIANARAGQTPGAIPGMPTSFDAATLAHLQGLMAIDGECHRVLDQPKVANKSGTLKDLHVEVTDCGHVGRCTDLCGDFRGMKLGARVSFALLDEKNAASIRDVLSNTSADAIVQIRMNFYQLQFYQVEGDKTLNVTPYFKSFEFGVAVPGGPDTPVVDGAYLSSIRPSDPQRFEIPSGSDTVLKIKQAIVAGKPVWIEVYETMAVAQPDLYTVRLGGGGLNIDFQPEFVVSAVKAIKGQL